MYHRGLTYCDISKNLGRRVSLIQVVMMQFITGINSSMNCVPLVVKKRSVIVLDETKVKLENKQVFLWTAVDVEGKEVIGVYRSRTKIGLDTYSFIKKVLISCFNKPLINGD